MQALGSPRARVRLIATPKEDAAPLLRAAQRHWGCDWTTLERAEQHEDAGEEELPVMKLRQDDMLSSTLVQLLVPDWASAPFHVNAVARTRSTKHTLDLPEAIARTKEGKNVTKKNKCELV